MKNTAWFYVYLIFAFFSSANAYETPKVKQKILISSLGSGYNTMGGEFLGDRVTGDQAYNGASTAQIKFKSNLSSAEKSSLIHGDANVSVSFAVFSASGKLDLDFVSKKTERSFSETMIYDVLGKQLQLKNCQISPNFTRLMKTSNAKTIFGDCFVDALNVGGRLILDISINFGREVDTTKVKGNVQVDVMKLVKGSASATVEIAEILEKSEITIRAKQIGGDATQLHQMFGNIEDVVSCGSGDYQRCTDIIKDVMQYTAKFGQQLSGLKYDPANTNGPAILGFSTRPYEVEGLDVFANDHPVVSREILRLQEKLTNEYFSLIEDIKYIDEKIKEGAVRNFLDPIRDAIEMNISNIISAIEVSDKYPDSTLTEAPNYFKSKISYQIPDPIVMPVVVPKVPVAVPTELYKICSNCNHVEKLVAESSGKYRIMKEGNEPTCVRCNSEDVKFECRADDAVYLLTGQKYSNTIIHVPGIQVKNTATFTISPHIKLDNLKTVLVEIKK